MGSAAIALYRGIRSRSGAGARYRHSGVSRGARPRRRGALRRRVSRQRFDRFRSLHLCQAHFPLLQKCLERFYRQDGVGRRFRAPNREHPMNAPTAFPDPKPVPPYKHTPLFPLGPDTTPYKKVTTDGVRVEKVLGKEMLVVSREALRALSEAAFGDINHYLRPGHLKQLRSILDDKEASDNDKFVAFDFLKNANIAAGGVLPMCQDTGTAIIMGKKGFNVLSDGDDEAALSEGARDAYLRRNLRYSQVAPLSMYEEKNTANNMPAQCEIYAEGDDAYKFMFMA